MMMMMIIIIIIIIIIVTYAVFCFNVCKSVCVVPYVSYYKDTCVNDDSIALWRTSVRCRIMVSYFARGKWKCIDLAPLVALETTSALENGS